MTNNLPSPHLRGLHPPPWEQRERYGLINALVLTIRQVLGDPDRVFRSMPVGLGFLQPILFAAVLALIGAIFDWMWGLTTGDLPPFIHPQVARFMGEPWLEATRLLVGPVVVVAMVFVRAALFHLVLVMFGADRLGFEGTLRVVAYSRATRILSIIPFCGAFIGAIWELVITVIGLVRLHECPVWQAVLAVVLPALVLTMLGGFWLSAMAGLALLS